MVKQVEQVRAFYLEQWGARLDSVSDLALLCYHEEIKYAHLQQRVLNFFVRTRAAHGNPHTTVQLHKEGLQKEAGGRDVGTPPLESGCLAVRFTPK